MSAALHQLDELLYDSLESLSLPDVYIRLREVMESDNASMSDVAEVLSLDPALAARILQDQLRDPLAACCGLGRLGKSMAATLEAGGFSTTGCRGSVSSSRSMRTRSSTSTTDS